MDKTNLLIFLLLLIGFINIANGQEASSNLFRVQAINDFTILDGIVLDLKTNFPVPNAGIQFDFLNSGQLNTDEYGVFTVEYVEFALDHENTITVSHDDYYDSTTSVNFPPNYYSYSIVLYIYPRSPEDVTITSFTGPDVNTMVGFPQYLNYKVNTSWGDLWPSWKINVWRTDANHDEDNMVLQTIINVPYTAAEATTTNFTLAPGMIFPPTTAQNINVLAVEAWAENKRQPGTSYPVALCPKILFSRPKYSCN